MVVTRQITSCICLTFLVIDVLIIEKLASSHSIDDGTQHRIPRTMYSQVAMNLHVWCDISDVPSYLHFDQISSATIMGGYFRGIWLVDMMTLTASSFSAHRYYLGITMSLAHTARALFHARGSVVDREFPQREGSCENMRQD